MPEQSNSTYSLLPILLQRLSQRLSQSLRRAGQTIAVLSLLTVLSACAGHDNSEKAIPQGTTDQHYSEAKAAYDKGDWQEAVRLFEQVRIQAPTSELAQQATYYEAMARFNMEMYSGAAVDFRSLVRSYPNSALTPRAQYMIGESYYKIAPQANLDQSYSTLAASEFQTFLRLYPRAPQTLLDSAQQRITEIRNKLAEKNYLAADLYVKMRDPKSAIVYFNRVLDQYYDTPWAAESALRIAEVQYDRGKPDEARKALDTFEQKYLASATPDERQRALSLRNHLPQP